MVSLESLWSRLRERKLAQWAAAYLAGAWLLLQVLSLLAQPFAWPDLVLRAATIILAVGFLAAMVLAWYHGERGRQKATGIELLMLGGILVIAASVVTVVARTGPRDAGGVSQPVSPPAAVDVSASAERGSIAVLPFLDMSPTKDQEYLADGIAEQLINALTKLEGLRVPARTSAFAYKGKSADVRDIAGELGVAHVLEGSVMKAGNRVRITAQLSDARTGTTVWSDRYDRELSDIFAVQDEISQAILAALRLRLGAGELASLTRHGTDSPAAYEAFLLGLHHWSRRTVDKAQQYFEGAIAADSGFARAHAMLAVVYLALPEYRGDSPKDTWPRARAAAAQAFAIDSTTSEARLVLAHVDAHLI